MDSSNSKDRNLTLVVVVGREGALACNVRLGAYNTNKILEFIQIKVIPTLDR